MNRLKILASSLFIFFTINGIAQTPVEVKLVAPGEEDRGWCLDLRGGQNNGSIIGGLHGHTCYSHNGNGPTADQAFFMENIEEQNEFRMVAFDDKCATLYEPRDGAFISMETCDGREAQEIVLNESGQITPAMMPELCITAGTYIEPGGGGDPVHIMRGILFETCDSNISERQTWELRAEWTGPEEATAERSWPVNPVGRFGN